MSTIAFTICSVNYLAQAKVLGESLKKFQPDYQYYIGLVDKLDQAKLSADPLSADFLSADLLPRFTMIEVADLQIDGWEQMYDQYNIIELNTAVKPFYMNYFYDKMGADQVIYFDPDIQLFSELTELNEALGSNQIVLTPHITSPLMDDYQPRERDINNVGVFNLGFIGTSKGPETKAFLQWWMHKLRYECYSDLPNGMFVDQLWVNFAPMFYNSVYTLKHKGYNMAYWNLHERNLTKNNDTWSVNDVDALRFFHYSGFSPNKPTELSKYQNRFTLERENLTEFFGAYCKALEHQGHAQYKTVACAYIKPQPAWIPPKRGQRPRKFVIKYLEKLIEYIR
jgi:hypothetical protein